MGISRTHAAGLTLGSKLGFSRKRQEWINRSVKPRFWLAYCAVHLCGWLVIAFNYKISFTSTVSAVPFLGDLAIIAESRYDPRLYLFNVAFAFLLVAGVYIALCESYLGLLASAEAHNCNSSFDDAFIFEGTVSGGSDLLGERRVRKSEDDPTGFKPSDLPSSAWTAIKDVVEENWTLGGLLLVLGAGLYVGQVTEWFWCIFVWTGGVFGLQWLSEQISLRRRDSDN